MTDILAKFTLVLSLLVLSPGAHAELPLHRFEGFDGTARRGAVTVPMDYGAPDGPTTEVQVVVLEARSGSPEPDPIVYLVGGPGRDATSSVSFFSDSLQQMQQKRDLVLIDIRGTGGSDPARCALSPQERLDALLAFRTGPGLRRCFEELGAKTEQFSTEIYARDVEAVRAALGAEKLNLVGTSYGTRLALAYARLFPHRTRTLTLRGVLTPDRAGAETLVEGSQSALEAAFARCAASPACAGAWPRPASTLEALLEKLEREPLKLEVGAAESRIAVQIDAALFEGLLRFLLYDPRTAAQAPALIGSTARGEPAPLAQAVGTTSRIAGSLSAPVLLSYLCREELPAWKDPATAGPLDGRALHRNAVELCQAVPPARRTTAGRSAAASSAGNGIPTLALSGELDPATPPTAAEPFLNGLSNAVHVVVPGLGHLPTWTRCLSTLMADFIEAGKTAGLDLACAREAFAP